MDRAEQRVPARRSSRSGHPERRADRYHVSPVGSSAEETDAGSKRFRADRGKRRAQRRARRAARPRDESRRRTDEEAGGILNPAAVRGPQNELLLYPRCVARGNVSRIGTVQADPSRDGIEVRKLGFALEPQAPYERRPRGGYGCEDPRVTYIPALKAYVMAYTAFGPDGPRVAFAISNDAYRWERLGLARFDGTGTPQGDDKDAAFFPEPVTSPAGVRSLAFYHRPMLHLSALDGRAAIPMIERLPFEERESIRIGYVPLEAVLKDRQSFSTSPRASTHSRPTLTGARSRSAQARRPYALPRAGCRSFTASIASAITAASRC